MIAVDFGLKRIGMAWNCNNIILPLPAINFTTPTQVAKELQGILGEKKVQTLIVGIVREELQGILGEILAIIDFNGKIIYIDENLSSMEAESHINGRKNSKKLRKDGTLDSLSAMIILERYLRSI